MGRNFICILFFSVLIGCTTNSVSDTGPEPKVPETNIFNMAINGIELNQSVDIVKVENNFVITSYYINKLSFDKEGHFGNLTIDLHSGSSNVTSLFYSLTNYSSHYINFKITAIDEVNKRIKGTLSGNIYHDPFNKNSESKYVVVNFDCNYLDVIPVVKNLKNQTKINGIDWNSTYKYTTAGAFGNNNNITQHYVSDNEYEIMVNYNLQNISLGTYNYTVTATTNNIKLAKYDVVTGTNVTYNSLGTLNIVQKENQFILSGNYSFTAVNPNNSNDIIQVTDGLFKLVHRYF